MRNLPFLCKEDSSEQESRILISTEIEPCITCPRTLAWSLIPETVGNTSNKHIDIPNGKRNPREPRENETMGGTLFLNSDET
jgi:hypothetical protein